MTHPRTVDMHVHVFDRGHLPQRWHEISAQLWAARGEGRKPEMVLGRIESGLTDADGSLILADLDDAGLDSAAMIQLDYGVSVAEAEVPPAAVIEYLLALQAKHYPRLVAFSGVDPRRPEALELTRKALDGGARGVKLYPPAGFFPYDPVCDPIYRLCSERGVPVMFHTAFIGYPMLPRYAHPMGICDVQNAYPELRIILAHAGNPTWREEAILVAERHPYTWLELSQWNRDMAKKPAELREWIARAVEVAGARRVLFASDHQSGPRMSGANSRIPKWAAFLREMATPTDGSPAMLTESDLREIMGGAASRLLGLTVDA